MNLLLVFFLTTGIVINVILLWLLLKSKKELPQKILILFFTLSLFYLVNVYAEIHKIRILYVSTFIFYNILEIVVGPLIFIYIKSIFQDKNQLIRHNWYHFIPAFVFLIFVSIPFFISILKRAFIFNYLQTFNNYQEEIYVIKMLYLIAYSIWSIRLFGTYKKAMKSNYSSVLSNNFHWIKLLLVGIFVISCFDLSIGLYEIYIEKADFKTEYITVFLVICLLLYLGYYGVKQTTILIPEFLVNTQKKTSQQNKKDDRLANLNSKELTQLKNTLENAMANDKLYLDENLTLIKLAAHSSITDKQLSSFLNQHLQMTFFDYVNSYRITSVKEKLKSPKYDNLTLLGVAYESGFKSKTSFNRVFKKETGMSPSTYKLSTKKDS